MTKDSTIYLSRPSYWRELMTQPYRVKPRQNWSREDSDNEINRNSYLAYGPSYEGATRDKGVVDCPSRYRQLLREVSEIPGVSFHTAADLIGRKPKPDEILCHLRHDVDFDLVAALELAKIEHEFGIRSTYYILHTAPYYGVLGGEARRIPRFGNKILYRNEKNIDSYLKIQSLGHEIGLHTDALTLYQSHNINGSSAIITELEWLRSNGLLISGSVSHNSFPVYGADNSAIFKNRPIRPRLNEYYSSVIHNGKWSPLGVLDENDLKLDYEGNDIFSQKDIRIHFYSLRGQNEWGFRDYNADISLPPWLNPLLWFTQEQITDKIKTSGKGGVAFFAVHPMHYGFRSDASQPPRARPLNLQASPKTARPPWQSFNEAAVTLAFSPRDGSGEYQSIIRSNQDGMFDVPDDYLKQFEDKILVCGRTNIHAQTVSVGSKISQVVRKWVRRNHHLHLGATSVAAPDANAMALAAWADRVIKTHDGLRTVFFPVGANDIVLNRKVSFGRLWSMDGTTLDRLFPGQIDEGAVEAFRALQADHPGAEWNGDLRREAESFFSEEGDASWKEATDFMAAAVEWLKRRGVPVTLLVDECGETCGRWSRHVETDQLRATHAVARRRFEDFAGRMGIGLVDPYEHFLSDTGHAGSHWKSTNEWSLHGHDIAGRAVIAELERSGVIKRKAAE